jgi:nucleoside-diphosphate-sugar epimerase
MDEDFRRINYDGSINVFEAARDARVPKFIFASSAQVYAINAPVQIDQFPILETNYCPDRSEGQTAYGFLKRELERYLGEATTAQRGATQAISFRLEFPGMRSTTSANLYVSTSIENLLAGFFAALEAPDSFASQVFNLCDPMVDVRIVDIQRFLMERWPEVPNFTTGNESLLSPEKARATIGYRPAERSTYFHA